MTPIIAIAALVLGQAGTSIKEYVQPSLHDASFRVKVVSGSQRELSKINKDFGQSYRFEYVNIKVKEPFMIRTESNVEDTNVLMVLNGTQRLFRVPRAKISTRENLSNSPGKRQTMMDFGILTPSLFEDFFTAKFVRFDRVNGDAVFDVTYNKRFDDTSRHRIWVDRQRKIITRREWYAQNGRQLATFSYQEPKEFDGVWMPTKVVVRNVDNAVAGVTAYDAVKVNTGLPDSQFSTH